MTIIAIRNPGAFTLPEVADLMARAFADGEPAAADTVIAELTPFLTDPGLIILAAREGAEFHGLAVAMAPSCRLFSLPTVYHFFCDGSAETRQSLVRAVVEWAQVLGYTGLEVVNGTKRPDRAWERVFRKAGALEPRGTVYRITFAPLANDGTADERQAAE